MFDLQQAAQKDRDFINGVWEKLDKKLSVVAERSRDKIPYTTVNGVHDNHADKDICWWTNGFWSALMWLMYYGTKNDAYKLTAERGEELLDGALANYDGLHHDVGFMWHISAGANYRITGNKAARSRALIAANILAGRYNLQGRFIRAWNSEPCVAIIDCMMNIPLLYWASREIGDPRFRYIAMSHADTTMKNHVRPDGSVKHIVVYDAETGEYVENLAGQGYSVDSSWSRGQAWALHGFVLSYIHTGKQEYLDTAKRVAHYFIANVCDDYMPRADFRAPEEPVIYDSTAGACAACGLLELARNVPEHEGRVYYNAALNLLKALDKNCCNYSLDEDSVVQLGTERWLAEGEQGKGVHIPIIYGDYYFTEAIYKLKGFDLLFE
ncbi:MAG: glycoside hydrolase family 88 protein [Clostridia bacterium]